MSEEAEITLGRMLDLSPDERLEIMRQFCRGCGVDLDEVGGRCHCENDE